MKKSLFLYLCIVSAIFLGIVAIFYEINYNGIVTAQKVVDEASAQVETALQRRLDLVPNLVETVKGYAQHEKDTLEGVITARNQAQASLKALIADKHTEADIVDNRKAQDTLTGMLSKVIILAENYPDLKANSNFMALQDQLEGTENRIAVARHRYNSAIAAYNMRISFFPGVIVAKLSGFKEIKDYFKSSPAAHEPVAVKF